MQESFVFQYQFPTGLQVDAAGIASLRWPEGAAAFDHSDALTPNSQTAAVLCQPSAFSADECAATVAVGLAAPRRDARVELGADAYRVGHIAWIEPTPDNHWLFHKLGAMFMQVNQQYGFDMVGFIDALQYTEYGPGQYFEWHMDIGTGQTSLRKLSLTVQLSDAGDYDGGGLEFVGLGPPQEARLQGAATFFPSYLGHRVTPVTRGLRRSLVAWGSGAPFR